VCFLCVCCCLSFSLSECVSAADLRPPSLRVRIFFALSEHWIAFCFLSSCPLTQPYLSMHPCVLLLSHTSRSRTPPLFCYPHECSLINVAFGEPPFSVPDRKTGLASLCELRTLSPEREYRFVQVNVTWEELERHRSHVYSLLHPSTTVMDLTIGCALWFAARGQGMSVSVWT
jgi:hypothetical protein